MATAGKRKEPEPSEAPKTEAAAAAEAPKTEGAPAAEEPDAKRLKPTPHPDPAAVRKQVEYYMSDENLRFDKFFHEKITEHADGWLEMALILSCNKMKAMRATKDDVTSALKDSKLELKEDGSAVRRPANAQLPKLEARPQHVKKTPAHAHDGGAIVVFKDVPAEQSWQQIKEKLRAKLPQKVGLWFVSEINDKSTCTVVTAPFENDLKFFQDLSMEVGGATIKAEVAMGEVLQAALKILPKHIREKREKESRKKQKERNKPIIIGTQKFVSVAALRGRVKEILNSRSDGENLKPDGTDFKLVKALLEYHPKGAEKSNGMVGIKVGKSTLGDSRCFHMVREDGSEEDFSAKKCLDAVEMNPPYVPDPTKDKKKTDEASASAVKKTSEAAAIAEPMKVDAPEGKKEEAKEEEKKEEKVEEKKDEPKEAPKEEAKEEAKTEKTESTPAA